MNLPFELHVALRYLLAKRKQAFISVISLISTLGVIVGVMALVIALALMTGLQGELRDRILGSTAHVYVFRTGAGITRLPGRRRAAAKGAARHRRGAGHPRAGPDHERAGEELPEHQGDRPGAREERHRHRPLDEDGQPGRARATRRTCPRILLGCGPGQEARGAHRRRGAHAHGGGHPDAGRHDARASAGSRWPAPSASGSTSSTRPTAS